MQARVEREEPLIEEGEDTPFPGFDAMTAELHETEPAIWLTVRDSDGNVVRRLKGEATKGFHRVNWDLRFPYPGHVSAEEDPDDPPIGFLVTPGEYTVSLSKRVRGQTTELVGPQSFTVKRMREGALPEQPDTAEFWAEVSAFYRSVTAVDMTLAELEPKITLLSMATQRAQGGDPNALDNNLKSIQDEANTLSELISGNVARNALYERTQPTVRSRLDFVVTGLARSTYGPTQTQREQLGIAKSEFDAVRTRLKALVEQTIPAFETELITAGAPWVPGAEIP